MPSNTCVLANCWVWGVETLPNLFWSAFARSAARRGTARRQTIGARHVNTAWQFNLNFDSAIRINNDDRCGGRLSIF